MDKVHFVGSNWSKDNLSADQKAKLETLATTSSGLVGINCFSNFEISDDEALPVGMAMYFDTAAIADSTLISDNLFEVMAVSKIIEGPYEQTMDDKHFSGIGSTIEQHSLYPPALGVVNARRMEIKPWENELGGLHSFVGAYYALAENHRDKDYYLIAQGTAPQVVQDLKNEIQTKQPTYGDLLYNSEWQCKMTNAASLCKRNVQRNLARAAMEKSVSIRRDKDRFVSLVAADHAAPEIALCDYQQVTHSIKPVMFQGKQTVAFYNGVVPKDDIKNNVYVAGKPSDSIYMFPMTKTEVVAPVAPTVNTKGLTADLKASMKSVGWSHKTPAKVMVCVAIKQYDPAVKRDEE